MKKNLGKIYLLLFFPFLLFANSDLANYTLSVNKKRLITKEAIELTFVATQKDDKKSMFFFFEPKKSDQYKVELLTHETHKASYHNSSAVFKYLIFPLRSGDITVNFDFVIKVASDEEIAQMYIGDYARVKWVEIGEGTKTAVAPLVLHVTPLKQQVYLVGDFTLESKLQKNEINQYGSANIRYTLKGTGFDDKMLQPLGKIANVTLFSQITDIVSKTTSKGYELQREYSYALSSKRDFTIPAIEIQAYSLKKQKYYTLKSQSYNIKVSGIDPSTLIDKKEFPLSQTYDFEDLKNIFIALLIFLAGFFTAKIAPSFKLKRGKKQNFQDIKECKSAKELILILLQNYKLASIKKYIDELELLEYKKSERTFQMIKTDVLKNIM